MNNKDFGHYHLEDFISDESFINYCLRKNPQDILLWENWILNHPEKEKQVEKAEYYVRNFSITLPEDEYREELDKIKLSMEHGIEAAGYRSVFKFLLWNPPLKSGRRISRRLIQWLLPAVVLMLFAGYVFMQRSSLKASEFAENFNNKTVPLVFTLSDGSVITLAPNSGLKYPKTFDLSNRKVYLNGEATFQVTTDITRPFKVFQNDLVCTVLGTVFTIRKERKDSVMMVELILGKLKVEIAGANSSSFQPIILLPNERMIYTPYNKHLFKEKWQRDKDLSQRTDHMVFRQDNFDTIANKIKAVFGIVLMNHSDKKNWRFTGGFTNSTAEEIITGICRIEGLTSETMGDTIVLK